MRAPRSAKAFAASLIPKANAVKSGLPHFLVPRPSMAAPKSSSKWTNGAMSPAAAG